MILIILHLPRFIGDNDAIYLPCRQNFMLTIVFTPSRGEAKNRNLILNCRKIDQSFLISYMDHDDSVAQASVVFPLPVPPEKYAYSSTSATRFKIQLPGNTTMKNVLLLLL
jgi:hypothetical protein